MYIDRYPYLQVCELGGKIARLPEGVHVIAMDRPNDPPVMALGGRLDPPDHDHIPNLGASFVVVSKRGPGRDTRVLYVDLVHEKVKGRRYLYAIAPATVAADAVTSPIQLIMLLICLAGACA